LTDRRSGTRKTGGGGEEGGGGGGKGERGSNERVGDKKIWDGEKAPKTGKTK